MRKLALVFVITLAFSPMAMALDIAISTQAGWWPQATADTEMQDIVKNVTAVSVELFTPTNQAALATWVKDHTGDGAPDLLILCGQFPATIYAPGNTQTDGSLAELFLDDGNTIINTGDYMFYVVDGAGTNAAGGLQNMMDIPAITMWDRTASVTPTAEAKEYTPSFQGFTPTRPWHLDELTNNWEPELILGRDAAGTSPDPAIIVNTVTGGRLGTFFQVADTNTDLRGEVISEWINNWYLPKFGGPNPLARKPNPKDKSMIDVTMVQASWKAGDFAKLHDVYFGESFDDVNAATPDSAGLYVGRQAVTELLMGMAGGVAPDGLVPGKTYYWRVDEVDTANPASPWKGKVWSFDVRPLVAWKPSPSDGMKNVDPNQDLGWEKGIGAIVHTVYFGRTFDAVNNAAVGMPTANPPYEPGKLDLNTTYYWRVDEFAFPANKTYKGPVWSFSTYPPGSGAEAQYFNGIDLAGDPIVTRIEPSINGNWGDGEVAGGLSDLISARWKANLEAPSTETWRIIASSDDGVRLWLDGRMVVNAWILQGTTDYRYDIKFNAGQVYSIVMEWYENGGGAVARLFWQSPSMARQIISPGWLQLPVRSAGPYPANGAVNAPQTATLSWVAGGHTDSQELYFGEDKDAVTAGTTPTATLGADETTYDPGALVGGKTYYWRVDEVNATETGSPWKGVTWSFTVADFLVVDNFELYTDEVGERIFQTWLDGLGYTEPELVNGNGTGSIVGSAEESFAELVTVRSDFQAMPMDFNNAIDPFYSQADRTWATAQNWTAGGLNTLVIHAYSSEVEGISGLYVTLEDSTGKSATVSYTAEATADTWVEWPILLTGFSPVNPAKIKAMSIGVGNPISPTAGGAGRVFIDDIWVIKR